MERHKCLPNPFASKTFKLLNSSQTEKRICDKNQSISEIESNYCQKFCLKDCNQIYFSTRFDNSLVLNISETNITINYENSVEFQYTSEPKYSFFDYLSNIGGLCGLWFGFSFIDMSEMIKAIIGRLRILIIYSINLHYIIQLAKRLNFIKFIMLNFRKIVSILEEVSWKLLISCITLPIILYQIWELTDSYLKYKTEVSVEWIPYRDSENRLKNESIPAITVCFEHIFQRILFDEKVKKGFHYSLRSTEKPLSNIYNHYQKYFEITSNDTYKINIINYILEKYNRVPLLFDSKDQHAEGFLGDISPRWNIMEKTLETIFKYINVKDFEEYEEIQKQINDKTSNDFNETQKLFDIYSRFINCISKPKLWRMDVLMIFYFCDYIEPVVQLLSPFGKCHTYRHKIDLNESQSIKFLLKSETVLLLSELYSKNQISLFENSVYLVPFYMKSFFIHDANQYPDHFTEKIQLTDNSLKQITQFSLFLSKYEFKKLPKPYETQCQEYGDSYADSNRFECLNKCYRNGYNRHLNCTPNHNHLLTIQLNDGIIEPKVNFCFKNENVIKDVNRKLKLSCFMSCPESCKTIIYRSNIEKELYLNLNVYKDYQTVEFKIIDKTYIKFNFNAKMLFIDFIINITNILSLWHGISFANILIFLFFFVSKLSDRMNGVYNLECIRANSPIIAIFKV